MFRARFILIFFAALFLLPSISEARRKKWGKDVRNRLSQQLKTQHWKNKTVHLSARAKTFGKRLGARLGFDHRRGFRQNRPGRLFERNIDHNLSKNKRMMRKAYRGSKAHKTLVDARSHFKRSRKHTRLGNHQLAIDTYLQGCVLQMDAGRLARFSAPIE